MKSLFAIIASLVLSNYASALTYDSNVPKDIKTQMIADLEFMTTLKGSKQTPYHAKIFGKIDGESYKTFFESRVKSVGINSCGGGAAVACVIPLFYPTKMWLTKNFIEFSHPQIARMMVVYHEARHTESANNNWYHDTCPKPFLYEDGNAMVSIWTGAPLAGEAACDATAFGSYGSSTILLKNISLNCENCTDKVKMDAGIYADNQLGRIDDPQVKKDMLADFEASEKNVKK